MIGGFEEVTEGKIYLGDADVTDLPPFKRATNTVFQSYALFPHLNIFENIAFGLRRRGTPTNEIRHQVAFMLKLVELPGFEERRPSQLSGGQQQRDRAGAGAREQPAGPVARRAARRARPQAAQADADRAEAHPERDRHHLHLRHPRPGGGDDDVRSHRRHARRQDRAARHAGGALRAPGDRVRRRLPGRQQPARRRGRRARGPIRGPAPRRRDDAARAVGGPERRDEGPPRRAPREAARARHRRGRLGGAQRGRDERDRGRRAGRVVHRGEHPVPRRDAGQATASSSTPRTSRPAARARCWPTASACASPGSRSTPSSSRGLPDPAPEETGEEGEEQQPDA